MSHGRGRANVGCSGGLYRAWRGLVYPDDLPQRRWFEHYATLFDTVEINNTFYRLPQEKTMDGWAAQAPGAAPHAGTEQELQGQRDHHAQGHDDHVLEPVQRRGLPARRRGQATPGLVRRTFG